MKFQKKHMYYAGIASVLLFSIYIILSPYFAISAIKEGLQNNSDHWTGQFFDMMQLHKNIKEQISSRLELKAAENKILDYETNKTIRNITDPLSDILTRQVISKQGLLLMFSGKDIFNGDVSKNVTMDMTSGYQHLTFLQDAEYKYDSMNRFSVLYKGQNNKQFKIILSRDGIVWKVTNIELPITDFANAVSYNN